MSDVQIRYDSLASEVRRVHYIVGPSIEGKFDVLEFLSANDGCVADSVNFHGCSRQNDVESTFSQKNYNLTALVDFYAQLKNAQLKNNVNKTDRFLHIDSEGKRYITLNETTQKLFNQMICSCSDQYVDPVETPFAKSIPNSDNIKFIEDDDGLVSIVKEEPHPSILVQNKYGSTGLTKEYFASRRAVLGSTGIPRINYNAHRRI